MPRHSDNPPDPDIGLVIVFRTWNEAVAAVAKSLLDANSIEYMVRGEHFSWTFGRSPWFGANVELGPLEFVVGEADAERAEELLSELRETGEEPR